MSSRCVQHLDGVISEMDARVVSLLLRLPNVSETIAAVLPRDQAVLQVLSHEAEIRATDAELFHLFSRHTSPEACMMNSELGELQEVLPISHERLKQKLCACVYVLLSDMELTNTFNTMFASTFSAHVIHRLESLRCNVIDRRAKSSVAFLVFLCESLL